MTKGAMGPLEKSIRQLEIQIRMYRCGFRLER
jgi:hypothetical protein